MSDTLDLGEEFIEHYGVKGMHWGIRKDGTSKFDSGKKFVNKVLDDLDIPGRPNRRSNTMSAAQLKRENSGPYRAGQVFTATSMLAFGVLTLAAAKM